MTLQPYAPEEIDKALYNLKVALREGAHAEDCARCALLCDADTTGILGSGDTWRRLEAAWRESATLRREQAAAHYATAARCA